MWRFKAVLFDWDGTLNDSIQQNYAIYGEIFSFLHLPQLTFEEFQDEYEADYRSYFLKKGVPRSRLDEMDAKWHSFYAKHAETVKPNAGAVETIRSLADKGILTGVVSNGYARRIRHEMARHGLREHLETLVTFDEIPELKPSPAGILHALTLMNVNACDTLYVGDMVEDVRAGKNAGVKTAAVSTGMHSMKRLAGENPDFLFSEVRELLALF